MKVEFYDDDGTLDFVEDITELRNVLDCHSYRHFEKFQHKYLFGLKSVNLGNWSRSTPPFHSP